MSFAVDCTVPKPHQRLL
uniref:Uncharacterized protein n=1 Tax=Anopheles christyi TaxID=43041 RepID=A0A182KIX6_9DIPT